MGKFGKGFTLAFFFISVFCHAQEAVDGGETRDTAYPLIERLDWRDLGFRQYMADVEANRRRVFLREKIRRDENRESAAAIAGALTVYRYIPREGEDIFALAARCSIPYSSLASLNRFNHPSIEAGKALLLPTVPGIFVPEEPRSDLEHLLASSRFPPEESDSAALIIGEKSADQGIAFYFFPGGDFNSTERAFFLNTGFQFPLRSYRLTSSYGMRKNPVTGNIRLHEGVDLAAPAGTEVYAAGNGVVTEIGDDPVYGIYVVISHGNNWASLYGHLQRVATTLRATVKSGTLIGWVGTTGQSTGPHLHFELRQNGRARDPDKYLFLPSGQK